MAIAIATGTENSRRADAADDEDAQDLLGRVGRRRDRIRAEDRERLLLGRRSSISSSVASGRPNTTAERARARPVRVRGCGGSLARDQLTGTGVAEIRRRAAARHGRADPRACDPAAGRRPPITGRTGLLPRRLGLSHEHRTDPTLARPGTELDLAGRTRGRRRGRRRAQLRRARPASGSETRRSGAADDQVDRRVDLAQGDLDRIGDLPGTCAGTNFADVSSVRPASKRQRASGPSSAQEALNRSALSVPRAPVRSRSRTR